MILVMRTMKNASRPGQRATDQRPVNAVEVAGKNLSPFESRVVKLILANGPNGLLEWERPARPHISRRRYRGENSTALEEINAKLVTTRRDARDHRC